MLLRTRIVLIFGLAMLALLATVAAPLWVMRGLTERSLTEAWQEAQGADWRASLADAATPYEILSARLADDVDIVAAVAGRRPETVAKLLATAAEQGHVVRLDVLAQDGHLLASSAGLGADAPLIDTINLQSHVLQEPWLQGIEVAPDGTMLVVITSAFVHGTFLSVAVSAEPVLKDMARGGERSLFLVDRRGNLRLSTAPDEWKGVQRARTLAGNGPVRIQRGGRTFNAVSTPLLNTAGLPIATLVSVDDVTAAAQQGTLALLIIVSLAVLVFAALLLALYGFAKGALDPLSEITRVIQAMAAGDSTISADTDDRRDEVGEIGAALEVFRRDIVTLARNKTHETIRAAQQQALIRQEMAILAGTLEEDEREALMADLRSTLDSSEHGAALADAFKRMAARVVAQHARLGDLLAERSRDLAIVREALGERAHLSRLRQELEVARHLQLSSLPRIFPPFPDRMDFDVFASIEPAKEVGGDFYDFALLGGDRLAVMIGDASGKGVSAAMFIAMGRSILRSAIVRGASPAQALGVANSTLAVENHTMMFATVFVGVLDLSTGWMTYASAGHNPPYLATPGEPIRALMGDTGIALGIMDDAEYLDQDVQMTIGSSVVLFTDGVTEANAPDMSMFGEEGLESELAGLPAPSPEQTVLAIQAAVRRFANGAEQADDITVLAARWLGQQLTPTAIRAVLAPAQPQV